MPWIRRRGPIDIGLPIGAGCFVPGSPILETGILARDVAPFLERPADAALLERVNLDAVLAP